MDSAGRSAGRTVTGEGVGNGKMHTHGKIVQLCQKTAFLAFKWKKIIIVAEEALILDPHTAEFLKERCLCFFTSFVQGEKFFHEFVNSCTPTVAFDFS